MITEGRSEVQTDEVFLPTDFNLPEVPIQFTPEDATELNLDVVPDQITTYSGDAYERWLNDFWLVHDCVRQNSCDRSA